MALFKFTKAMLANGPIQVFNYGNYRRDFTYIDDIVEGVIRVLDRPAPRNSDWRSAEPDPASSPAPWRIYNVGNNRPVSLMDYMGALEKALAREAKKEFLPLQAGDVSDTFADVEDLSRDLGYRPSTSVEEGIGRFVSWYREYFQV